MIDRVFEVTRDKIEMIGKTVKPLCWIAAGLVMMSLSACHHPCSDYLKYPPKIPLPKIVVPPKPVSLFQQREYYVCWLEKHGVQVIRLGQTWKIILPGEVLFNNDTAEINDSYRPVLAAVAGFLRTYSKISVEIASFSNETPSGPVSKFGTTVLQELTTRQSDAVARYLSHHHINARLIYSVGKSGWDPIAWPGSEKGRYLNRRTEINFRYYRDNKAWY